MATRLQNIKWNLYRLKYANILKNGLKSGLIHRYEKELIENLRNIYYHDIPASIVLLCNSLCNGYCYERSLLIAAGFGGDDFKIIDADIDGLKLNPLYIDENKNKLNLNYAKHCFVERIKSDGSIWIYDTSIGLVFDKKLYYKIQNPRIVKRYNKETILNHSEYKNILNSNIKNNAYIFSIIISKINAIAKLDSGFYSKELNNEIELFKQKINYYDIDKRTKNIKKVLK